MNIDVMPTLADAIGGDPILADVVAVADDPDGGGVQHHDAVPAPHRIAAVAPPSKGHDGHAHG